LIKLGYHFLSFNRKKIETFYAYPHADIVLLKDALYTCKKLEQIRFKIDIKTKTACKPKNIHQPQNRHRIVVYRRIHFQKHPNPILC